MIEHAAGMKMQSWYIIKLVYIQQVPNYKTVSWFGKGVNLLWSPEP